MKRFLSLLLLCLAVPVVAQTGLPPAPYADRQLDDPRQEAAARDLMEELRCLKCQSQSIADSNAPMAGDMRSQVRERIAAGETPEAVRSWLIERYGNWVSYDPPIASAVTWPLWIAPIILLLAALWLARGRFRKSKGDE
ncbi:MAG: cytochrome c-type biogenesis protein CcmH [Sphingomonadales bacterium]|nr:cytochrome c-type biogenesis protein CcmH [Sphingomonadales bacterium]PIX65976.1 MAG: cytochrome C biogenesis protein [Sphingomonadales bacterium CG_4_10_14_3_um_filter_58_15]NCO48772.1 cytochrome c-type biogenesis protein CcmH [Sphingomonadales bacterium]NCO99893.1 cytochrome c-type biogenesis protein CcmH [Sphingomonadales bacterium]NCP27381.1 cytochrome c-type biogenesis protein CcmH [Sphingomonadales bacterium]